MEPECSYHGHKGPSLSPILSQRYLVHTLVPYLFPCDHSNITVPYVPRSGLPTKILYSLSWMLHPLLTHYSCNVSERCALFRISQMSDNSIHGEEISNDAVLLHIVQINRVWTNRNVSHLLQVRTHISIPCKTPQVAMSVGLVNAVHIMCAILQDVNLCHFE
jgi:hypothetical protein